MSAAKAAETFPEAAFRSHRREPGGKRGGTGAVLRATGDVLLPEALAVHVEFVSGLTELWVPDVAGGGGMGKLDGAGAGLGRFRSSNGMEVGLCVVRARVGIADESWDLTRFFLFVRRCVMRAVERVGWALAGGIFFYRCAMTAGYVNASFSDCASEEGFI